MSCGGCLDDAQRERFATGMTVKAASLAEIYAANLPATSAIRRP